MLGVKVVISFTAQHKTVGGGKSKRKVHTLVFSGYVSENNMFF
jgi:hypothetical protein